jgi:hypothetical protein
MIEAHATPGLIYLNALKPTASEARYAFEFVTGYGKKLNKIFENITLYYDPTKFTDEFVKILCDQKIIVLIEGKGPSIDNVALDKLAKTHSKDYATVMSGLKSLFIELPGTKEVFIPSHLPKAQSMLFIIAIGLLNYNVSERAKTKGTYVYAVQQLEALWKEYHNCFKDILIVENIVAINKFKGKTHKVVIPSVIEILAVKPNLLEILLRSLHSPPLFEGFAEEDKPWLENINTLKFDLFKLYKAETMFIEGCEVYNKPNDLLLVFFNKTFPKLIVNTTDGTLPVSHIIDINSILSPAGTGE